MSDAPEAPSKIIVPADGAADAVTSAGIRFRFLATAQQTAGAYALLELLVLPNVGPPMHRHPGQEAFLVQEGEFQFHIDDQAVTAPVGTFVSVPPQTFHVWKNSGATTGRLFCWMMPGGMEGFFREAGVPVTDLSLPPPPRRRKTFKNKSPLRQSITSKSGANSEREKRGKHS